MVKRMRKKQENKNKIISQIESAAKSYKKYLVGKKFLYVFEGQCIEVLYKVQHFRHLTGVETILSAKRFFHNAVNNKLQSSHIFFSSKHPYGLCLKKLKHINEVATLAGSESFMLEEIITNTQTYKFGTTDLNFSICMNMETDETEKQTGI